MKKILCSIWSCIKRKWWYILLLVASSWFVYQNRVAVLNLEFEKFNSMSLVFIFWLGLLMLPLFSEMELFGIKLKKEVEKNRAEAKDSINELKAQMFALSINNSQVYSPNIQILTEEQTKVTLSYLKTSEEDKKQAKQKVDDFVSDKSIYLFKVRLTLEKILGTLCKNLSYLGIPSTGRMLAHVLQNGWIDKKIADYISQVNAICNRGIHGEIISGEYIKLVETLMPIILSELNAVTSRLGYPNFFVCPRCKFSGYTDCKNECPECGFVSDED